MSGNAASGGMNGILGTRRRLVKASGHPIDVWSVRATVRQDTLISPRSGRSGSCKHKVTGRSAKRRSRAGSLAMRQESR